jgi:Tfp pilus assembly protein PilN
LTELKQSDNDVVIDGKATTQTAVSDFVASLEASGYFKRSVDIVSTTAEPMAQPPGELVKFSIKAVFQQPGEAGPPVPAGAKPGG